MNHQSGQNIHATSLAANPGHIPDHTPAQDHTTINERGHIPGRSAMKALYLSMFVIKDDVMK